MELGVGGVHNLGPVDGQQGHPIINLYHDMLVLAVAHRYTSFWRSSAES
jgi:hypothetical protein